MNVPIEYKTYGCKFKCGHKHGPNRAIIYQHELNCWYNPEVRSCLTCRHGELFRGCYDPETGPDPAYRSCLIDESIEFDGIKPQVNCERWEENLA